MAKNEDRTRYQPTPMSDDQAEGVVGGQNNADPVEDPFDGGEPCYEPDCFCTVNGGPACTCDGHSHTTM